MDIRFRWIPTKCPGCQKAIERFVSEPVDGFEPETDEFWAAVMSGVFKRGMRCCACGAVYCVDCLDPERMETPGSEGVNVQACCNGKRYDSGLYRDPSTTLESSSGIYSV